MFKNNMQIFILKNNKLEKFTDTNWLLTHNVYRYGNLKSYTFVSDIPPVCNLCGKELIFQKKGKYINILSCSNTNCKACGKSTGDTKLKAFLPENIYNDIRHDRNYVSYYDKDYLINKKGLSSDEAENYIKAHKELISNNNKGHNKQYFIDKFGEDYNIFFRKRNKLCIEYWLERGYSKENAIKNISDIQKYNSSCVKNRYILSYDKFDDKQKAELFFKLRSLFCIEYWLKKGYNYDLGIKQISILLSKASLKFWTIFKLNPEKYKYLFNTTVEYWLSKGYTYDIAKQLLSNRQKTFSKEICILKYGKDDGLRIFNDRQVLWQKTLLSKLDYNDIVFRRCLNFLGYSKISLKLFDNILKYYNDNDKAYVFYKTKNKEYFLKTDNCIYFFDFVDLQLRKIIEFNGDVWHANPTIFSELDTPFPFDSNLTSKEIWEKDNKKIKVANDNNFLILIIWEKEYNTDKENILNKCKQFLNL